MFYDYKWESNELSDYLNVINNAKVIVVSYGLHHPINSYNMRITK